MNLHLLWKNRETLVGTPVFPTVPTTTFDECPEELDVLAVGAIMPDVLADPEVIEFFGRAARRAEHVVAVCGGVILAGAAGLLEGKRATTNFQLLEVLPEVGAIPVEGNEVVRDGNIWTAGPASASYEVGLLVLAELRGEEIARRVELDIQYAPTPPFGTGSPELAGPELTAASRKGYDMVCEGSLAALAQLRKLGVLTAGR
ncbi:hypothetical protein BJF78_29480 [Pseudonocardia sp. CNS-139]|nr:hypothetical protein BJF78_29480 [Pseudonocardia sp. CNS-139]